MFCSFNLNHRHHHVRRYLRITFYLNHFFKIWQRSEESLSYVNFYFSTEFPPRFAVGIVLLWRIFWSSWKYSISKKIRTKRSNLKKCLMKCIVIMIFWFFLESKLHFTTYNLLLLVIWKKCNLLNRKFTDMENEYS